MNTDTPETDAIANTEVRNFSEYITEALNLCRKLERHRNELSKRLNSPVRCHSGHERRHKEEIAKLKSES